VPEDPQAAAQWLATVAFFQTLLLACNLGPGFKRLCRPKSYGAATVETVRRDFLAVPGRWVNRAPRQGLHLPRDYPWRAEWLGRGPGDPEIASAPKKSEFVSEPGTRIQCGRAFLCTRNTPHAFLRFKRF
jgi:hypothetical protein